MTVCPRCRLVAPLNHAYPDDCIAMLRAVVDEVVLQQENARCKMPLDDGALWGGEEKEAID